MFSVFSNLVSDAFHVSHFQYRNSLLFSETEEWSDAAQGDVVESPSLELFRKCLGVVLRDMV